MAQEGLLLTGAIAAIAGIGVLRLSWGRDHRSATLNTAGWALLGGGTVAGWLAAGAWGATVVSLWAIGAALVCLAAAAWISPPARRAASKRRAGVLPEGDEPLVRYDVTLTLSGREAFAADFGAEFLSD